jgi:glycosyltransferase involved in cell wall biosynthesis
VAWPDRWSTWWLGATLGARGAIRRFDPDVVWSTYPIATAHWIGASLHRALRKPWVADFRDPMTEDNYPDPTAGRLVRRIERTAVARAARCVVTTPGAQRLYREWYPDSAPKWRCIPNGFDEEAFAAAEPLAALRSREPAGPIRLVHTGIVYPVERNPKPLFDALASLARRGWLAANPLRVVLRATGHDEQIRKLAVEAGAAEHVDLLPAVPYRENLAELLTSDGLLLMQGSICNDQIPAKVYEYIRARRPVLALTDPIGDTAAVLRSVGLDRIAPLDDAAAIERAIVDFVDDVRRGAPRVPTAEAARGFDRRLGTERLAALLDEVVGGR